MKIRIDKNCFFFDSRKLEWGMEREQVRSSLELPFEVQDIEFDFLDPLIIQKRDVFGSYESGPAFFFCNYDGQNGLYELEIHKALDLEVAGKAVMFGDPLMEVYYSLSADRRIFRDEEGTLVLPEQKMTIASSEEMGGEGDGLAYLFFSASIEHLGKIIEEK